MAGTSQLLGDCFTQIARKSIVCVIRLPGRLSVPSLFAIKDCSNKKKLHTATSFLVTILINPLWSISDDRKSSQDVLYCV